MLSLAQYTVITVHVDCQDMSSKSVFTRHSRMKTDPATLPNDPFGQTSNCCLLQL